MKPYSQSIELGGKTLTLSVGKLAKLATTSVFARWGDTTLLAVVTAGKERSDIDYFPLSVDYVEKLYAGGIIKGSRWVKREGKPTDESVLKGRIIDRSIRPLFPKSYRRDVQVVAHLLSYDGQVAPEMLACIAVSAALHLSSIPWAGPIATSQVGYIDGALVAHPTALQLAKSSLDMVATSVGDKVNMIETKANILPESVLEDSIKMAKVENAKVLALIEAMRTEVGLTKDVAPESPFDEELLKTLKMDFMPQLETMIEAKVGKENNDPRAMDAFVAMYEEKYPEKYDKKLIAQATDYLVKKMIREKVLANRKRLDGRALDEVRFLAAEVGLIPRVHGSALFQRGDTQVLDIVTLASGDQEQWLESPAGMEHKRYMHHYNFPPYSVGETGRIGFTNRREIGHGALAEKAIEPVLPDTKDFPYAIRVVSEVLGSNGSTSMGSTCGSSLALMDAGVPLKAHVAGIAMGIMSESDDDYIILTDIMGVEDFCGEMDFKVAGTTEGVTAIQLDVKNMGLTDRMIAETLAAAKLARLQILDVMSAAIATPRAEVSVTAPKVVVVQVAPDKIGEVIGPGGKHIRALMAEFTVEINMEDDGRAIISGIDKTCVDACAKYVADMVRELTPGEKFQGKVTRVESYGAFLELVPGKTGLIHVSALANGYVHNAADLVKLDQVIEVEVVEIDAMGRINIKPVTPLEIPEHLKGQSRPPSSGGGGDRGSFGGGHRDRRSGGRGGSHGGGNRY